MLTSTGRTEFPENNPFDFFDDCLAARCPPRGVFSAGADFDEVLPRRETDLRLVDERETDFWGM
jgi:hypothetical protein